MLSSDAIVLASVMVQAKSPVSECCSLCNDLGQQRSRPYGSALCLVTAGC